MLVYNRPTMQKKLFVYAIVLFGVGALPWEILQAETADPMWGIRISIFEWRIFEKP